MTVEARNLAEIHGGVWGEHPDHPVADWKAEVNNNDTRASYWDWVISAMENMSGCYCGSGLESEWQFDARGIELCKTCLKCHDQKMDRYRQDVLNNPNYECDEPIEED